MGLFKPIISVVVIFLLLLNISPPQSKAAEPLPPLPNLPSPSNNLDESLQEEISRIEGIWTVESQQLNGFEVPAKDIKNRQIVFGKGVMLQQKGKEILQVATFNLNTSHSQKQITATSLKGLYQGEILMGIYQFEQDKLCISFDLGGPSRPENFHSKSHDNRLIVRLKRHPEAALEQDPFCGKFHLVSKNLLGKNQESEAEIIRHGDVYLVKYFRGKDVAYVGVGLKKKSVLAVSWTDRGEAGISLYELQEDGSLSGEYSQLGILGVVHEEKLFPANSNRATTRQKQDSPIP